MILINISNFYGSVPYWSQNVSGSVIRKWETTIRLASDYSHLLSSPNKQSGKYNKKDPILIGTAVSDHVIRDMSKPAIPLVKALWQTIIFINIHDYVIINVSVVESRKPGRKHDFCQHPRWRIEIYPKMLYLSLLDNHHFGMWKVDQLSWRSELNSGNKFASWS